MISQKDIDHSSGVSESMSRLFLNERLSDVVFIVDGKQIVGHKAVLAIRSPTFMDMLFDQTVLTNCRREIHIKDCSALSFKNFIKYIYTGKLSITCADESDTQELMAMALKYQMNQLVECLLDPNAKSEAQTPKSISKTTEAMSPTANKAMPSEAKHIQQTVNAKNLKHSFEDIANMNNAAVVVEGLNPHSLFAIKKDLDESCLTRHKLEDNTKGIIIRLNVPVIINAIRFRLLDVEPKRYFCYYVQVYTDSGQWQTLCDHRQYSCRSWQCLAFSERLVQFIRIVGTNSNEKTFFSNSRYFTIVSLFCGLTRSPPNIVSGFWEPEINCASIGMGAIVIISNGNDYCRSAKMINTSVDFEFKRYNKIFSEFYFDKSSELIIHLSQPIITSTISFYIFGDSKYKYTVKVSADIIDKEDKKWTVVADRQDRFHPSKWQRIAFNKTKVLLISIANIRCIDQSVTTLPIVDFSCP